MEHYQLPNDEDCDLQPGRQQASDDATVPHAPDNRGSSPNDPDQESDRSMRLKEAIEAEHPRYEQVLADHTLVRQLRLLHSVIEQLESTLLNDRTDDALLTEIDVIMQKGLSTDPRCAELMDLLDEQHLNSEVKSAEAMNEAVRHCERVKATIEHLLYTSD